MNFAEIKSLLQMRARELAQHFAPVGFARGANWIAKNPTRADRKAGSLIIYIAGEKAGGFVEFADNQRGDVFGAIAYFALGRTCPFSQEDYKEAYAWAQDWLGLRAASPADRAKARREAFARREAAAKKEAEEKAYKARRAFDLWLGARTILGSGAEKYLAARGIDYQAIQNRENSLRFYPRLNYFSKETPHAGPAMIAALRDARGEIRAVHLTWLNADCSGKCSTVPNAKLVYGPAKGCAIWLSRGPSGLDPLAAARDKKRGPLFLSEGIETGLTVAECCPELRVWAGYSLGNLSAIEPPICADAAIIGGENDWHNPQAQRALEAALAHWSKRAPTRVAKPGDKSASDFNDLIRPPEDE